MKEFEIVRTTDRTEYKVAAESMVKALDKLGIPKKECRHYRCVSWGWVK